MNYDVDYFIDKYKAIPEERWCTNVLSRGEAHCAYGHCDGQRGSLSEEGRALTVIIGDDIVIPRGVAANINDGKDPRYQQPTPKQRILAALRDIKAKHQTVLIDHPVKELATKERCAQ